MAGANPNRHNAQNMRYRHIHRKLCEKIKFPQTIPAKTYPNKNTVTPREKFTWHGAGPSHVSVLAIALTHRIHQG